MIRALCALFVLCAISCSTSADNAKPLTTILLVARADLPDPSFKDSIVLVMNDIGPSPAGVIINRPTRIPVSRVFPSSKPWRSWTIRCTSAVPSRSSRCRSCFALTSRPNNPRSRFSTVSTSARTANCCASCSAATSRWKACGSSSASQVGRAASSRARSRAAIGLSSPRTQPRSSNQNRNTLGPSGSLRASAAVLSAETLHASAFGQSRPVDLPEWPPQSGRPRRAILGASTLWLSQCVRSSRRFTSDRGSTTRTPYPPCDWRL